MPLGVTNPKKGGETTMAKRTASPAQIREWAISENIPVGVRGRLSQEVVDQFYKAHTPSGKPKALASV